MAEVTGERQYDVRTYVDAKGCAIREDMLAVWFTPECLRDHFAGSGDDVEEFVMGLCEAQLVEIGKEALWDDRLWGAFHAVLIDVISERRRA
jgi:hypothetical protein